MRPEPRQHHGDINLPKAISDVLHHGARIDEALFHCPGCKAAAEWIVACLPPGSKPDQSQIRHPVIITNTQLPHQ